MRFVLALLLSLLAGAAHAQLLQTGAGKTAGPTYVGPIDAYGTGAISCYLPFACGVAQADGTHVWTNVSRSSDSYTETCDILLGTNGLSTVATHCSGSSNGTAIATWCAASSGSCQGNSLYDQLNGLTTNKLVFNGSTHPQLTFSCFGSQPCYATGFTAGYSSMETASYTGTASTYTHITVFEAVSDTTSVAYLVSATTAFCCDGLGINPSGTIQAFLNAGGTSQPTAISLNTLYAAAAIVNGGSSKIVLNGAVNALSTPGTNGLGGAFALGSGGNGGNDPFKGYYLGAITYNAPLATGSGNPVCKIMNNLATFVPVSITGC